MPFLLLSSSRIAFGSKAMGQLLVWEWQSETYILKQQGHYYNISSLDYSPDGSIIATGGEDSKVKLWNTNTGYCYVTFKDHTANVTGVAFVKSGHALVSCSLDGTVRAFDLIRYRNFRVLTTPSPVQFTCVAVDPYVFFLLSHLVDPATSWLLVRPILSISTSGLFVRASCWMSSLVIRDPFPPSPLTLAVVSCSLPLGTTRRWCGTSLVVPTQRP